MNIDPGKQYRTKYDDSALRWKAGEVGLAVENQSQKYDATIDFGVVKIKPRKVKNPSFLDKMTSFRRVYFFYADELEEVLD